MRRAARVGGRDTITLAELLDGAGYHSMHIGKWHLGGIDGMAAHDQGFDESLEMRSGLYLPEDDPGVVNAKQGFDQIDQFLWRSLKFAATWNGGDAFEPERYLTDYYTDQAVAAIDANQDRPFFLYLAYWAPHVPLPATREDYDAPVQGFDIFATAAAAAGAALPSDRVIDGVDLMPHLLGERAEPPHRTLFWRTGQYRVVLADGWKLQLDEGGSPGTWLFDLSNDPGERTNLAEREPERVAALRRLLDADQPDDEYIYWPN